MQEVLNLQKLAPSRSLLDAPWTGHRTRTQTQGQLGAPSLMSSFWIVGRNRSDRKNPGTYGENFC